jgi:hypothetical protein
MKKFVLAAVVAASMTTPAFAGSLSPASSDKGVLTPQATPVVTGLGGANTNVIVGGALLGLTAAALLLSSSSSSTGS